MKTETETPETPEQCGACKAWFPDLAEVFGHDCEAIRPHADPRIQTRPQDDVDYRPYGQGGGRGHGTDDRMTEKQGNFIRALLAEREGNEAAEGVRVALNLLRTDTGKVTKRQASEFIDALMALPKNPPKARPVDPTLPDVPQGHYAYPSTGDNDLAFVRIDRPTTRKWAGYTFAKWIVGGHPEMPVRKDQVAGVLARIVEFGVEQAQQTYGQEIGRCAICNRTLTDETSRERGIGPECWRKM